MSSPVQLQLFDENSNAASTAGGAPSAASLAAAAAAAAAAQAAVAASQPTAAFSQLLNVKDSRWLQVEVCREFQRGQCARSDQECKFAHPPQHVDVQQGRVTACYDSIKGRCTRENPKCKYLHPPQHIKDQLLINGKNNLALKNMLLNGTQQQLQVNPLAAAQLLQQQQSQQLAASMAVPQMAAFPYYHQGLMFQPYQQMQQLDPYQSLLAAAASQPVLAPQLMLAARHAAALAGAPLSSAPAGSAPGAVPAARKRTREDDDDLLGVASKRSAVDKVVFPPQQQFNPYLMNLQYPSVSFSGGQQLPPRF